MNTTKTVAAIVALSLSLGNVAFAQSGPHPGPGDMDPRRLEHRDGRPGRGHAPEAPGRGNARQDRQEHARQEHAQQEQARQERARHERQEARQERRDDNRHVRDHRYDNRRFESNRHDDRHYGDWRHQERWDHRDGRWNQRWERGAGPQHNFYRGGRLPPYYRNYNYVVNDWQGHHLRQPPVGYHWVQAGGDYVLVAIASGVILSILLSN